MDIFIINGKIIRIQSLLTLIVSRGLFHLNCIHLALAVLYSIITNKWSFNLYQSTELAFMPIFLFLWCWPVLIFDHLGHDDLLEKSISIPELLVFIHLWLGSFECILIEISSAWLPIQMRGEESIIKIGKSGTRILIQRKIIRNCRANPRFGRAVAVTLQMPLIKQLCPQFLLKAFTNGLICY